MKVNDFVCCHCGTQAAVEQPELAAVPARQGFERFEYTYIENYIHAPLCTTCMEALHAWLGFPEQSWEDRDRFVDSLDREGE